MMRQHLRRTGVLLAAAVTVVAAWVTIATPASALPAFGTAPVRVAPPAAQTTITAVRVGRHAGFDRVVFDVRGRLPGYQVRYVPRVTNDPTGAPVPLAGAADILVVMEWTNWLTAVSPRTRLSPNLPALRQIRFAGEFEAQVSYGIGQATRAGFRVFTLTGPNRLVIDVRHP